jgi:ribonuclease HII
MPTSSPDLNYELSLIPRGTRFLLGIDEVGRGPWAGPVTIGAFLLDLSIFDPQIFINLGVRDS